MQPVSTRAGRYVRQPSGYRAFVPAQLPPEPRIAGDDELLGLLSRASLALGRLDGVSETLPDPDLFVGMYVRQEAVLSSQIEGTQSSVDDVLEFELDAAGRELPRDVTEVVNYVRAMNYGLQRMETLPLSLRLIREIHAQLMEGVRGSERSPGEFRTSQNWIGPAGTPLDQAIFVPPPVAEMQRALDDFEKFLYASPDMPILLRCGLAHAQFETIHPFLDGNGRVGRLLIALLLVRAGALSQPLLYISSYLKRHRNAYYGWLSAIRERGDWEGWLRFFLLGVAETAEQATATARAIVQLREQDQERLQGEPRLVNTTRLLRLLYRSPIVTVPFVEQQLGITFATANRIIATLVQVGILDEITGSQRNRRFRYSSYVNLFEGRSQDS